MNYMARILELYTLTGIPYKYTWDFEYINFALAYDVGMVEVAKAKGMISEDERERLVRYIQGNYEDI